MTTDTHYKKLFCAMQSEQAPECIVHEVNQQIAHYRVVRARIYLTAHATLITVAVIAFIPAIQYIASEASDSGLFEYISLITSDGSVILGNWKEFSLLIAESLPVIGGIACLGTLLLLVNSTYRGIKYIPKALIKTYA